MKICVIENIYAPYDRGGAEQVVAKTIRGLLGAGHEVILLTSSPKGDEYYEEDGFKIYRKKPKNIYFYTDAHRYHPVIRLFWHLIGIFNLGVARWVDEMLEQEKPDIVHTHNLMGLSFLIPRIIRKRGLPHVHTIHDVQLVEPSGMILKAREHDWRYTGLPTKLYSLLMRTLLGSPDIVISPSKFLLDFYTERGFFSHSSCQVLRNPITFDLPAPQRTRQPLEDGDCHFFYLGQLEPHKGVHIAIEAFSLISKKRDGVHLHIAGSGSQEESLKKIAGTDSAITFYGRIGREQISELFPRMDVTIVPSLCYENSPTVIFESHFFGVPVLASRIEGVAELIEEGENGMTFDAGQVPALVEKMEWVLTHPETLAKMSSQTAQSLPALSSKQYIKTLLALYHDQI